MIYPNSEKFNVFENFLCCSYYQTVWFDYSNDLDIWIDYKNRSSSNEKVILLNQIDYLLSNFSKKEIMNFINDLNKAEGLFFSNESEAFKWLFLLRNFLKNNKD